MASDRVSGPDSSSGQSRQTQQAAPTRVRLKWFNPDKGFGFVAPIDGGGDAFLHVSALQKAGLTQLPEGVEMVCEIGRGAKGPQVLRILEAAATSGVAAPQNETSLTGAVKWFAAEKGFGFVAADDGGKDVFVHKNVLRRCGIQTLLENQRVEVTAVATAKGREAIRIVLT